MDNLFEKQLNSTNVYKGRLLDVYSDDIELPNGNKSKREYIKHVGAACVVPVDKSGNVIIEKQFRYPFGKILIEIPAGKLEWGEDHRECGIRELREETGYSASEFVYLGEHYLTPGFCNEKIFIYLATGLVQGEKDLDENEFTELYEYSFDELIDMIMKNEIKDGKTVIGILKAYRYLNKNE